MEKQEAEQIVASLTSERAEVFRQATTLQERMAALDKIVDGLFDLFPELREPAPASDEEPEREPLTMGEAFMVVLEENPKTWFSILELVAELEKREIGPKATEPDAAGRAAFRRLLSERKAVRRKRSGRSFEYRLYSPEASAAAAAANEQGVISPEDWLGLPKKSAEDPA